MYSGTAKTSAERVSFPRRSFLRAAGSGAERRQAPRVPRGARSEGDRGTLTLSNFIFNLIFIPLTAPTLRCANKNIQSCFSFHFSRTVNTGAARSNWIPQFSHESSKTESAAIPIDSQFQFACHRINSRFLEGTPITVE